MSKVTRLVSGLLLSSTIGLLAYRRQSLNRSGVVGAIITGTTTCGLGGWSWGFALIFFFLSSSLLSHFREQDKEKTAADKFSKGSQRDLAQVAANGGVATALALAYGLNTSPTPRALLRAAYIGTLATATADTWATELGVLSAQQPRLITTGKPTTPGTSGGITALGTGAAALGAFALGLVFWLLQGNLDERMVDDRVMEDHATEDRKGLPYPIRWALPIIALFSGLIGAMFDSVLGATVQAMYYCPHCEKETERRIHSCGTRTIPLRGIPWMNNDVVNFLATLVGGLSALILSLPFLPRSQRLS